MSQRPGLTVEAVRALAATLLSAHDVTVSTVRTPGMETQAFRVQSESKTGCLRIGQSLRGFHKDAWVASTVGDHLRVPAVWELGSLPNGQSFCLTEWITGATLQDLSGAELARAIPSVFQAWQGLAEVDITSTTGFGDLDPQSMLAPYASHHDQLTAELELAGSWPVTWTERHASKVSELLKRYRSLIDFCPNDRAFVHGDFGTNNVLIDADRVAAVIDWEAAGIGDPLQDVSGRFWAFWPPVSACVTALADFADAQLSQLPNYRERALCYDLRTGISEITECLADGDEDFAGRCLERCTDLLRG